MMHIKMNFVNISYFSACVVTLKLCNEYLNTVTCNTPQLLQLKTEQFDVQNVILCKHIWALPQKQSGFLPHPIYLYLY